MTTSYDAIPCNQQACCKITYEWDRIRNRYVPVSSTGDNGCEGATMTSTTVEAQTIDPATGATITYIGDIIESGPCEPMCRLIPPSGGSFTSGMDKKSQPIELTSNPTLVTDKIFFTTKGTIKEATVYDIKGKKVMEQPMNEPELNLQGLKSGVYFIQLQFENKEVHSIKIYKD